MREQGKAVSRVVDSATAPTAFDIGEQYTLQCPLEHHPRGMTFEVIDHDHETGVVALRSQCDGKCERCESCEVLLQPFETEDLLPAFRPYTTKRSRPNLKSWLAAAAIALLAIVGWEVGERSLITTAQAIHTAPFVWGAARFVSDVVEENGQLEVVSSHKYLEACDWYVTREFFKQDEKTRIATTKIDIAAIPISDEFQVRKFTIPTDGLKPGSYFYKSTLEGVCENERPFKQVVMEQNFTVVPRSQ